MTLQGGRSMTRQNAYSCNRCCYHVICPEPHPFSSYADCEPGEPGHCLWCRDKSETNEQEKKV